MIKETSSTLEGRRRGHLITKYSRFGAFVLGPAEVSSWIREVFLAAEK